MKVCINHHEEFDVMEVVRRSAMTDEIVAAEALRTVLKISLHYWVGRVDDEIGCVFGIIPPSVFSEQVYLWLLTTDVVDDYQFVFVRRSQIVIEEILSRYDLIRGHVQPGETRSRRWLRWLGAEFGRVQNSPMGPLIPFKIRRKS